ncbi:MAG TPA: hypothetical protein PLT64_06315 [Syntrophales bacterium]|nr:hypothetical protein [Syntrophales bacterium]HOL59469.1 hypothetical protein [Syntrophales bacterium]HPO34651.1 hypothetical protein [Syntrophales bacterium]
MASDPLFWAFVLFTVVLVYGFHWGRRENERIFRAAMQDLMEVLKPVDQTFTNIGGVVGYHARFSLGRDNWAEKVEATITFLPRHAWLYLPFSLLIRRHDRLFITVYLRKPLAGEGHLIEKKYARLRQAKITHEERLTHEEVNWGDLPFHLFYERPAVKDLLLQLMEVKGAPGTIRHVAIVGGEKRCFFFIIPTKRGTVKADFGALYDFMGSRWGR